MKAIPNYPVICIVDDKIASLGHLKLFCEKLQCQVHVAETYAQAIVIARGGLVDAFLLDVQLDAHDPNDRSGVVLAEALCGSSDVKGESPESTILFISRPEVIDAEDVLRMFNLRVFHSQDAWPGFRDRLAEGYADKDEPEAIFAMVRHILHVHHCWIAEFAQHIHLTEEGYARLQVQLDRKFRKFMDAEGQFFRLTRRLCIATHLQECRVFVSKISKGRSRSLVVNTRLEQENRPIDSRILKIGHVDTIEKELINYRKNVPRVLRGGAYPIMTDFARCRELGGIAYSDLGGGGGIPDSFGDCFWDISHEQRVEILDNVLHATICDASGIQRAEKRPFSRRYRDRFQALERGNQLHATCEGILKRSKFFQKGSELERMGIS